MAKIIFIDNKDSFTYNLVDELASLGHEVKVYRNDINSAVICEQIDQIITNKEQGLLVFSPGPGKPSDVNIMNELMARYLGKIGIFGICLGHQAIAEYYGGKITKANETIHGKATEIELVEHEIFRNLGSSIMVARYHSLIAEKLPPSLLVIGRHKEKVMAIIDEHKKVLGFQFHPESILTINGTKLIQQSISYLINQGNR